MIDTDILLQAEHLSREFSGPASTVHALRDVSIEIRRRDFVAVTGPSGAGKSTLLHLLGCLDRPTSGRVRFDGQDIALLSDPELSRLRAARIGFVFQTFHLLNTSTVLENVALPVFYARRSLEGAVQLASEALRRVGLADRADHLPSRLSGGEMQRAAVARAVINDPLLVLADEPTGNLDTATGESIMSLFHEINRRGSAIVIVTHNPEIAAHAIRRFDLRDGAMRELT